jgi:uncharacterized protein
MCIRNYTDLVEVLMVEILESEFDLNGCDSLKKWKYGKNWPVVYIIHNEKEAYIGETTSIFVRSHTHYNNPIRRKLVKLHVIADKDFNKSVVLDIESFLIRHMASDGVFSLQNSNSGIQSHDYFDKQKYNSTIHDIWKKLQEMRLVNQDIRSIENSDIFKFSPYKSLTNDQYITAKNILEEVVENFKNEDNGTIVVKGGAGTGKTVLGIYLMKLLIDLEAHNTEIDDEENLLMDGIAGIRESDLKLNIGLVIPMSSLRNTLKKVFKKVKGLDSSMVLSPHECVGKHFNILIVDEAHRLRRRKNLTQYKTFDKNNSRFNLGQEGTELDWIIKSSDQQILFFDPKQSIKPTDISKNTIDYIIENRLGTEKVFHLETQLRCIGGEEYINYVYDIFGATPPKEKISFNDYEIKIFDDVRKMTDSIIIKNKEIGLCRNVAGFSWKWKTKKNKSTVNQKGEFKDGSIDIKIGEYTYIWNTKANDWVNSPNSINEIGCIHTIQGYDLNYTGVIFGDEIKYDPVLKKIIIDRKHYFDVKGKYTASDEELHDYIINIYTTLMTRGIKGTYVYVCDSGLREYLKKYIESANE